MGLMQVAEQEAIERGCVGAPVDTRSFQISVVNDNYLYKLTGESMRSMKTNWDWIVPFTKRGHSGSTQQNSLCRSGNVFVMDNHRAALWCWLQAQDLSRPHSFIHIDRHTDTLQSRLKEWLAALPDWKSGIDVYLGANYCTSTHTSPVIRWDNYLSIYLACFGKNLKELRFLTHSEGDKPNHKGTLFSQSWELPDNLACWLSSSNVPWIVNIDLDYFFCDSETGPIQLFSDQYIDTVFLTLKQAMEKDSIAVLTLCLTPDTYTPGWTATEALATRVLRHLDLEWQLP